MLWRILRLLCRNKVSTTFTSWHLSLLVAVRDLAYSTLETKWASTHPRSSKRHLFSSKWHVLSLLKSWANTRQFWLVLGDARFCFYFTVRDFNFFNRWDNNLSHRHVTCLVIILLTAYHEFWSMHSRWLWGNHLVLLSVWAFREVQISTTFSGSIMVNSVVFEDLNSANSRTLLVDAR